MKKSRKILITIIAVCVLVGSLIAGFAISRANKSSYPDVDINEPNQVREFVRSEEFRSMDEEERREFFQKRMREAMVNGADEYCQLPEDQKTAYLDNIIDQMQNRMREFRRNRPEDGSARPPRDGNTPGPPPNWGDDDPPPPPRAQDGEDNRNDDEEDRGRRGPGRPRMSVSDMRGRSESMKPSNRAKMTQFMMDLHNRMQERGVGPPR